MAAFPDGESFSIRAKGNARCPLAETVYLLNRAAYVDPEDQCGYDCD